MESDVPWVAVILVFVLAIAAYVVFMIFLPEWVGITGKKALENEQAHRDETLDSVAADGANPDNKQRGDDGTNGH